MAGEEPARADLVAAEEGLARLVRRVRSLSSRALQERREPLRTVLAGLVALDAELEGRSMEPPDVADHMFADAISVIGGDALTVIGRGTPVEVAVFKALIDEALARTR